MLNHAKTRGSKLGDNVNALETQWRIIQSRDVRTTKYLTREWHSGAMSQMQIAGDILQILRKGIIRGAIEWVRMAY